MTKVQMGPQTWLYPTPSVLVGANVAGKPNFMTVAWCGVANSTPPMVSVSVRPQRYTNRGIRQAGAFSVNIPSVDMVREADYCGIVSGAKADKVEVCRFKVFYGTLADVPLIEQCPINLECRVVHTLTLGSNELIIGEVVETHVTEDCLTEGKPDIARIRPLIYAVGAARYYGFGEAVATAFSIGRELQGDE